MSDTPGPSRAKLGRARPGLVSNRALLVCLVGLAGTGHVLYPTLLHAVTRLRPDPSPPDVQGWPELTVVVPAYRETTVIGAKVEDVCANGYPGEVEVVVVADDPETAVAAGRAGARVLTSDTRRGKAEALNRGIEIAGGTAVVVTDANTRLVPGSLQALVRWFADPSVGAVAGEKTVVGVTGEGAYWRFESWLKRREARTGTTIGLVGELAAVRRETFRPLPSDLAVEDLWMALDVVEGGWRIAYEPAAVAVEEPSPGWRDDWERRTRVVSGTLDVLWRRRSLLAPRQGLVAAQLWGHRAVRSSFGPVAHLLIVLWAFTKCRRSRLAALTLTSHGFVALCAVRTLRGTRQSRFERLVGQALFLQAVGLGGLTRYLRHDRPALWPKPERQGVPSASRPRIFGGADVDP